MARLAQNASTETTLRSYATGRLSGACMVSPAMAKKSAAASFVMGGCREAASRMCTTATAKAATPNCVNTMLSLLTPYTCRIGVQR